MQGPLWWSGQHHTSPTCPKKVNRCSHTHPHVQLIALNTEAAHTPRALAAGDGSVRAEQKYTSAVEAQRQRINRMRLMIRAATVIQTAWRAYSKRKTAGKSAAKKR